MAKKVLIKCFLLKIKPKKPNIIINIAKKILFSNKTKFTDLLYKKVS